VKRLTIANCWDKIEIVGNRTKGPLLMGRESLTIREREQAKPLHADGRTWLRRITLATYTIVIACCLSFLALSAQAQESAAQKLLLDSVEKLDVSGVKTALDKGANPNWVYDTGRETYTAIHRLAENTFRAEETNKAEIEEKNVEVLRMLFKAGAKLQPDDYRMLFSPIWDGWAHFTEVLLDNGFDPTKEIDGETPMEIAVSYGQANIIKLLEKHGVPALEPRDAAQRRFIQAAEDHDIPGIENALDDGADVNGSNRQGETALVEACDLMLGDIQDSATVLYLLKKGADPTIQGSDDTRYPDSKTTALHVVVSATSPVFDKKNQEKNERLKDDATRAKAVIEALLQHGALVSARDWQGKTPLHVAAQWNNLVGAQILIDAGCKIMPHDREGKTPLDYAESAEMIKLLKDHGAKEE